jgi:lycopene beta-cyclase
VDIAILGGGSAGISLARKLKNVSALVIEPRTPAERDCSWALWADSAQQKEFSAATKGSWQQWRLVDHSTEIIHSSNQYRYTSLSAADYISSSERELADGVVPDPGCGRRYCQYWQRRFIYCRRPELQCHTVV